MCQTLQSRDPQEVGKRVVSQAEMSLDRKAEEEVVKRHGKVEKGRKVKLIENICQTCCVF